MEGPCVEWLDAQKITGSPDRDAVPECMSGIPT